MNSNLTNNPQHGARHSYPIANSSAMASSAPSMTSSVNLDIVDKLHGALASMRRERDELHRSNELSHERLRLVREERRVMEQSVNHLEAKLEQLNKEVQENTCTDDGGDGIGGIGDRKSTTNHLDEKMKSVAGGGGQLDRLRLEVDSLQREYDFQHSELMGKMAKYDTFVNKVRNDECRFARAISDARDAVRHRREKQNQVDILENDRRGITNTASASHYANAQCLNDECSNTTVLGASTFDSLTVAEAASLQYLLQVNDEEILPKLPRLVLEKVSAMERLCDTMSENVNMLERKREAYRRHLECGAS